MPTTLREDLENEKKQYLDQIEVWQRRQEKAKHDYSGEKNLCVNMVKVYQKKIALTETALSALNGNQESTPPVDA